MCVFPQGTQSALPFLIEVLLKPMVEHIALIGSYSREKLRVLGFTLNKQIRVDLMLLLWQAAADPTQI
jgi:hypothetical protein